MYKNYVPQIEVVNEGFRDAMDNVKSFLTNPHHNDKRSMKTVRKAYDAERQAASNFATWLFETYLLDQDLTSFAKRIFGITLNYSPESNAFTVVASNWNVTVRPEAFAEVQPNFKFDLNAICELINLTEDFKRNNNPNKSSRRHENMVSLISKGLFSITSNKAFSDEEENFTDPIQACGVVLIVKTIVELLISKDNKISLKALRELAEYPSSPVQLMTSSGDVWKEVILDDLDISSAQKFLSEFSKMWYSIISSASVAFTKAVSDHNSKRSDFMDAGKIRQKGMMESAGDFVPSIYEYVEKYNR